MKGDFVLLHHCPELTRFTGAAQQILRQRPLHFGLDQPPQLPRSLPGPEACAEPVLQILRENQLDKRFNIRSGEIRKDLETIYAKYKPQNAPKQVSNYEDYIRELEALYVKNGKQSLSPAQIRDFILTNNLGNKFGITIPDVQKDLKTIEEKYKQYGELAKVLQQKSSKDASSLSSILSQLKKKK